MEDAASAVFSRKSLILVIDEWPALPASKRLVHQPGFTKDAPLTPFYEPLSTCTCPLAQLRRTGF
jgi:hypothetical protein